MSNLTPDELARLRLKAKHGMLTPEEQQAYDDYATEQLSAVSSPPSGAVPPKKGFKWESEKVAEWRLKARHDGLDENERLLYLHAVRPEAGRWEYAGGILGVRSSVAWVIWDAQHFGVPQRRRRVFLVADFAGYSAIPILAIPDSVPGYSAPRRVPRQIAATLIGSSFAYAGRA